MGRSSGEIVLRPTTPSPLSQLFSSCLYKYTGREPNGQARMSLWCRVTGEGRDGPTTVWEILLYLVPAFLSLGHEYRLHVRLFCLRMSRILCGLIVVESSQYPPLFVSLIPPLMEMAPMSSPHPLICHFPLTPWGVMGFRDIYLDET